MAGPVIAVETLGGGLEAGDVDAVTACLAGVCAGAPDRAEGARHCGWAPGGRRGDPGR